MRYQQKHDQQNTRKFKELLELLSILYQHSLWTHTIPTLIEVADKTPPRINQRQEIMMLWRRVNQTLVYLLAIEPKKPPMAKAPIV
jgi:hypothetical protein